MMNLNRREALARGLKLALIPAAAAAGIAITPKTAEANPAAVWLVRMLPVARKFIDDLVRLMFVGGGATTVIRYFMDANRRRGEVWVQCRQRNGQTYVMVCEIDGETVRYYRR